MSHTALVAKQRALAPNDFERRLGIKVHQHREGIFSIGPNTRAAPVYDPHRNDRSNARVAPRHFWLSDRGAAPADWFVQYEKNQANRRRR